MTKENFDVTGMSCSACSARVERAVGKLVGADNVSVNLLTNSMQVKFDEAKISAAQIDNPKKYCVIGLNCRTTFDGLDYEQPLASQGNEYDVY